MASVEHFKYILWLELWMLWYLKFDNKWNLLNIVIRILCIMGVLFSDVVSIWKIMKIYPKHILFLYHDKSTCVIILADLTT